MKTLSPAPTGACPLRLTARARPGRRSGILPAGYTAKKCHFSSLKNKAVYWDGWRGSSGPEEAAEMNRIFDFLLGRDQRSATLAKERMKLVLIHDRTDLSPGEMEQLKDELIEVISRHVAIEPQDVRIEMAQDGRQQRLIADIPLRSVHQRRVR